MQMFVGYRDAHTSRVLPADWPNNNLIGDRVIIPPAKDIETAEKRAKEYECYDWWFCHRPFEK